ncbi:MAG: ATP-binding cassette domain-containing protein [Actinobacteria bacterium]|nr:ATP-binding cassette domain-containing protein [Actinomycetota bacterium]
MSSAEVSVIGTGSDHANMDIVKSELQRRLSQQSRVRFTITSMGASLEGSTGDIFAVAETLHRMPLEIGLPHVHTTIQVDERLSESRWQPATLPSAFESETDTRRVLTYDQMPGDASAGSMFRPPSQVATAVARPVNSVRPVPIADPVPFSADVAVSVQNISKTYETDGMRVEALRGVNLEIHRSEFVAIMGPSGSGKSTLMHILGALEQPTSGTLMIGNTNLAGLNDTQLTKLRRDSIGFVFQFFNLFKTLTAEENVMLPSMLAGEHRDELRDRAGQLLNLVGLGDRAGHLPSQMSGGQQQRVSIARALMREPDLLLADEPTGNLDSKNSAAVLDMLGELRATTGRTILMVTHDPVSASRASRIVFLRDGRIAGEVAGGDPDRIVEYFSLLGSNELREAALR